MTSPTPRRPPPSRGESHPTRLALLDAGFRIAARQGLAHMTVDEVAAEAQVAKGTYYVHFTDRQAYLTALYQRWHRHLMDRVRAAAAGVPAGADRLQRSTTAYLDACLAAQPVQAVLVAARAEPALAAAAEAAFAEAAELVRDDFAVLGFPAPAAAARLYVAAVVEAALAELKSGSADAELRDALMRFAG